MLTSCRLKCTRFNAGYNVNRTIPAMAGAIIPYGFILLQSLFCSIFYFLPHADDF